MPPPQTTFNRPEDSIDTRTAAGQALQEVTAACRLKFKSWGTHRTLPQHQKSEVADHFHADVRLVSAGKQLIHPKDERLLALNSVRSQAKTFWMDHTLPYVDDGVRLIRSNFVTEFEQQMEEFRNNFLEAAQHLQRSMDEIRAEANRRLGGLYNPGDYPANVSGRFLMEWDYPSTTPPDWLLTLHPALYQREQERIAARFQEAAQMAEEAFAQQLLELVEHLRERLTPEAGQQKKVFRDTAVENFREFFQKFRTLNVTNNHELEAAVRQAESLIGETTAGQVRSSATVREQLQAGFAQLRPQLEGLVTTQRRRNVTQMPVAVPEPTPEPLQEAS